MSLSDRKLEVRGLQVLKRRFDVRFNAKVKELNAMKALAEEMQQEVERLRSLRNETRRALEELTRSARSQHATKRMGVTAALRQVLREHPGLDARAIEAKVLAEGIRTKSSNPSAVVQAALRRMRREGTARVANRCWWLVAQAPSSRRPTTRASLEEEARSSSPYAEMSQRRAVLALLKTGSTYTPSEIAERLVAGGIRTAAKRFPTSVSALLKRLEQQGLVARVGKKGKWGLAGTRPANPTG